MTAERWISTEDGMERDPDGEWVKWDDAAKDVLDCMNYAWTIICNVSEGDWTKQRQEWQDAAARCRDQYHALLDVYPPAALEEALS